MRAYIIVSSVGICVFAVTAFTTHAAPGELRAEHARIAVLDVERLNVLEPNGMNRVVIANKPRSPSPMRKGKEFIGSGGTRPGLIFYDDEGSETGGLIFAGEETADGKYSAYGHLSFDQFHQNQVLVIHYVDQDGRREVGMSILDRHNADFYQWTLRRDSLRKLPDSPEKAAALRALEGPADDPRVAERVYVGRDTARNAVINLRDRQGRLRLRLVVDSLGAPRIEFLDGAGKVTRSFNGAANDAK